MNLISFIPFFLLLLGQSPGKSYAYPSMTWTQRAHTIDEAKSYQYFYHLDNSDGQQLYEVTCYDSFEGIALCSAKLPVTTLGKHTVSLSTKNGSEESPQSERVEFEIELGNPALMKSIIITTEQPVSTGKRGK